MSESSASSRAKFWLLPSLAGAGALIGLRFLIKRSETRRRQRERWKVEIGPSVQHLMYVGALLEGRKPTLLAEILDSPLSDAELDALVEVWPRSRPAADRCGHGSQEVDLNALVTAVRRLPPPPPYEVQIRKPVPASIRTALKGYLNSAVFCVRLLFGFCTNILGWVWDRALDRLVRIPHGPRILTSVVELTAAAQATWFALATPRPPAFHPPTFQHKKRIARLTLRLRLTAVMEGAQSTAFLNSLALLAQAWMESGRPEDSLALFRYLASHLELGAQDAGRFGAKSQLGLARSLFLLGRNDEAAEEYRDALSRYENAFGIESIEYFACLDEFVGCLHEIHPNNLKPYSELLWRAAVKLFPWNHPARLGVDVKLAWEDDEGISFAMNEFWCQLFLGPKHPVTVAAQKVYIDRLTAGGRDEHETGAAGIAWHWSAKVRRVYGRFSSIYLYFESIAISSLFRRLLIASKWSATTSDERPAGWTRMGRALLLLRARRILRLLQASCLVTSRDILWFFAVAKAARALSGYDRIAELEELPGIVERLSRMMAEELDLQVGDPDPRLERCFEELYNFSLQLSLERQEFDAVPAIVGQFHAPRLAWMVSVRRLEAPEDQEFLTLQKEVAALQILHSSPGGIAAGRAQTATGVLVSKEERLRKLRGLTRERYSAATIQPLALKDIRRSLGPDSFALLLVDRPPAAGGSPLVLLIPSDGQCLRVDDAERILPFLVLAEHFYSLPQEHDILRALGWYEGESAARSADEGAIRGVTIGELMRRSWLVRRLDVQCMALLRAGAWLSWRLSQEANQEQTSRLSQVLGTWAEGVNELVKNWDDWKAEHVDQFGHPWYEIRDQDLGQLQDFVMAAVQKVAALDFDHALQVELANYVLWAPVRSAIGQRAWERSSSVLVITDGRLHALPLDLIQGEPGPTRVRHYPGMVFAGIDHELSPPAEGTLALTGGSAVSPPGNPPLPFTAIDHGIALQMCPSPVVGEFPVGVKNRRRYEFGVFSGHGTGLGDLSIKGLLDTGMLWQNWLMGEDEIRQVFVNACLIGRVSEKNRDPQGWVTAFLLRGSRAVVAARAPIPDFYSPLFLLLFLQSLFRGGTSDFREALEEARLRIVSGQWYDGDGRAAASPAHQATEKYVRELYPAAMRDALQATRLTLPMAGTAALWSPVDVTVTWPVPPHVVKTLEHFDGSEPTSDAIVEWIVSEILDNLVRNRSEIGRLPRVRALAASMTCFGGGDC